VVTVRACGVETATAIHRRLIANLRRPSGGGARVTPATERRCADAKLTFNSQGLLPGALCPPSRCCSCWLIRQRRSFLQAYAESVHEGPASECAEGSDKITGRISIPGRHGGEPDPAAAATGAIFHRSKLPIIGGIGHCRDFWRAGDFPDGSRTNSHPWRILRREDPAVLPASSASPTG